MNQPIAIIDQAMVWRQFNIAIDALENALRSCPDILWEKQIWADQPDQWVAAGFGTFWYLGYHTFFWLDLYLYGSEEGFLPPEPFDLVEMVEGETLPRTYSRQELLGYLDDLRQKCRDTVLSLTRERAERVCSFPWGDVPYGELLIYVMRHVVEHAAQLHMFLGQQAAKS
jgi:hypothetical protein